MSSPRKEIRHWLSEYLKGKTQAQERVFPNRKVPLGIGQVYPVILIYNESEDAQDGSVSNYFFQRDYSLVIEARTGDIENVDDIVDDLAEEIEVAISSAVNNGTLHEKILSVGYQGSNLDVDEEGEMQFGSLLLRFNFKYCR
ncbi:hypothetical protein [Bdellovibrio bacteriovorus]|uniref:hypothetical protein n=1 Tax=Bdellovibrio bacteriovorus TaxID=959 RepID=UPI0035A677F4